MSKEFPKNGVKSVYNTHTILRALKCSGGSTITELASELDLTQGAIHNHLSTLESVNMVQKRGNEYSLGVEFLLFGAHVRNHSLVRVAKRQIDSLAMETGEIGHVFVEEDGKLYIAHEVFGENAVSRTYHIERRETAHRWLHCTASGKAILAEMDPERARRHIYDETLPAHTEHTIVDPDELSSELETIREEGYAFDREEHMLGINAVGAAVKHDDGTIAGSVSISGPTTRLQGEFFEDELPQLVKQAANISEVNLQTGDTDF